MIISLYFVAWIYEIFGIKNKYPFILQIKEKVTLKYITIIVQKYIGQITKKFTRKYLK